jgi:PIN domain nuclease of toxin-antitoxin system
LDTHAFLWFIGGSKQLSGQARRLIENPANERFLSVGSMWEMAIKVSIGKLEIQLPFTRLQSEYIQGNDIQILPIQSEHLDEQKTLNFYHNDPFDRLIISQAIVEEMKLISKDRKLKSYPVECIWGEEGKTR